MGFRHSPACRCCANCGPCTPPLSDLAFAFEWGNSSCGSTTTTGTMGFVGTASVPRWTAATSVGGPDASTPFGMAAFEGGLLRAFNQNWWTLYCDNGALYFDWTANAYIEPPSPHIVWTIETTWNVSVDSCSPLSLSLGSIVACRLTRSWLASYNIYDCDDTAGIAGRIYQWGNPSGSLCTATPLNPPDMNPPYNIYSFNVT